MESAEFAPTRIGGHAGRGWGPLLIVGWILVLGAVIGAGTIGRTRDGSSTGGRASFAAAGGPSAPATAVSERAPDALGTPGPTRSSDPDPLAYVVVRDSTGLSITGTVLARPVVWVFLSIQDAAGDVLAWRSLSVEDPNGGIRPDRAPAFEVHVPLAPSVAAGPLMVEVNAYNNLGRKIGSVRQAYAERAGHNPIRIGTGMVR